jgi:hypothetical protein
LRDFDEFRIARSTHPTGFMVGCRPSGRGFFNNQTSPFGARIRDANLM